MSSDETGTPLEGIAQISIGQAASGQGASGKTRRDARRKGARAPFFSDWRVAVAFALALVTFLGSLVLGAGLAAPQSIFGEISPLALVHDRRATALLSHGHDAATLDKVEAESWTALRQAPVDEVAWLNLAYAQYLRGGRMTDKARLYLRRSYDVAPFGPYVSMWRIEFALENWDSLDGDLRKSVLDDIQAQWSISSGSLRELAKRINNPAGRLAIQLDIRQLQQTPRT